ncbi:MAG: ATP-grasp domain-containing protein [Deltaproteobacteria bacterium]|nr:ATP-grasp domain-containing protein [Deltaproteobacteria bacterium]
MIEKNALTSNVLVLDGMWNKTLAVVRSLGSRGLTLTVGEHTRFAAALFSKYCARAVVYPSPLGSPPAFIEWLLKEVSTTRYDMVMPAEYETLRIILKHRTELEKYTRLPFGDLNLISNLHDKAWLLRSAMGKGFPCPKTIFTQGKDAPAIAKEADGLGYPLVIKPRESSGSRGFVYVPEKKPFFSEYKSVNSKYPFPLIQEFIPNGGAFGVGALFNFKGVPRAAFVYKRLREYPVSGGPSTLRESVKDETLKDLGLEILKSLKWTGLGMVEFRVDARTGKPVLMEINPRPWGSLHLAVMSGMDFPYLLDRLAVDNDIAPQWDYKAGVRCRWLIPGDLMHLASNALRFKASPGFFKGSDHDDIISFKDPLPLVGRLLSFLPFIYDKEMRRLLLR